MIQLHCTCKASTLGWLDCLQCFSSLRSWLGTQTLCAIRHTSVSLIPRLSFMHGMEPRNETTDGVRPSPASRSCNSSICHNYSNRRKPICSRLALSPDHFQILSCSHGEKSGDKNWECPGNEATHRPCHLLASRRSCLYPSFMQMWWL